MGQPPILVVDDDITIVTTVAEILRDEGYTVATACNGQEALTYVAQHTPGAILLDMKMPIMDGWAFATTYRARPGPHTPLIVMTAAHDAAQRAAEIQAQEFLVKPFSIERLLAVIAHFVARDSE
jgi:CheY-like chemotaxis protein